MAINSVPTALTAVTADEPDCPWSHASTFAELHAADDRWRSLVGGRPGFNPRTGNSVASDLLPLMVAEGLYNAFAPRTVAQVIAVGYEAAKVTESDMAAGIALYRERLNHVVTHPRWAGFDGRLGLFMRLVEAGSLYRTLYVHTHRLKPAAKAQAEQAATEYCDVVVPKALADLVPCVGVREPVGAAVAALRRMFRRDEFTDPTLVVAPRRALDFGLVIPLRDALRRTDPTLDLN